LIYIADRGDLAKKKTWLVGGAITILKNMSSSMGRINYPIYEIGQ
jgi:hypothetical protein